VATAAWNTELIHTMKLGDSQPFGDYKVTLTKVEPLTGPNYTAERATIAVTLDGKPFTTLTPERRMFTVQQRQVAETSIQTNLLRDLYATLGEGDAQQGWVIRLYLNPLAPWIWLGAALLRHRRLRLALGSSPAHRRAQANTRRKRSRPNEQPRALSPAAADPGHHGGLLRLVAAVGPRSRVDRLGDGEPPCAARSPRPRCATGEPALTSDLLKTGKPVLLNFFASWCTPCLAEHPLLLRLKEREGVTIIGIAWKNKPEEARAWLKKLGDPFAYAGTDYDGSSASIGACRACPRPT